MSDSSDQIFKNSLSVLFFRVNATFFVFMVRAVVIYRIRHIKVLFLDYTDFNFVTVERVADLGVYVLTKVSYHRTTCLSKK